jgi:hypothetical protein
MPTHAYFYQVFTRVHPGQQANNTIEGGVPPALNPGNALFFPPGMIDQVLVSNNYPELGPL